ncbi:hypothetical protein CGLO_14510 [Colletotrichum gloeosporioides Cg-14]|uniref:Uncharacterized protein n=1 Tax=Colletotrichum gloeosporioides (strain Cg-14) TaxID=1237896 RepID=T0L4K5_COLGC|nr:hypothetical protein CGLO_14510 [Colletotrichum gloeosporioides Cg-14]
MTRDTEYYEVDE